MKWVVWSYYSYEGWFPTVYDTEALARLEMHAGDVLTNVIEGEDQL